MIIKIAVHIDVRNHRDSNIVDGEAGRQRVTSKYIDPQAIVMPYSYKQQKVER